MKQIGEFLTSYVSKGILEIWPVIKAKNETQTGNQIGQAIGSLVYQSNQWLIGQTSGSLFINII